MTYSRTASGKVQSVIPLETAAGVASEWQLILQAHGLRKQTTGVHATVTIAVRRGNGPATVLDEDLFNVDRREDRNRLANAAVKSPLLRGTGVDKLLDNLQAELLTFCRGLWDFEVGSIKIERRGGSLERKATPLLLDPFVVEGGGTILFAPPGRGKSFTGLIWGVLVDAGLFIDDDKGEPVLGATHPAPVMFINLERGAGSVDDRLGNVNQALGLPRDRGIYRVDRRGWNLSDLQESVSRAVQKEGIELVILDSLTRGGFGDMNENLPANRAMDGLNSMGVAWVALAHTSRADETHVFGCYSNDTEVLTRRGWVQHPNVTVDDEVACFDSESETLRWSRPDAVHVYPYAGAMLAIGGQSQAMLVTPNHRMVHRSRTRASDTQWSDWRFTEARALPRNAQLPYATRFENDNPDVSTIALGEGDVPADALLRYIGWWISEGSVVSDGAVLTQRVGALADAMRDTVAELGFSARAAIVEPRGKGKLPVQQLRIKGARWFADWLSAECGRGAANKHLPDITWGLSSRQQRVIFDALVDGDGWRDRRPVGKRRGGFGGAVQYSTTSRRLADDVQRLAIELGHSASVKALGRAAEHHHDRYVVLIGNRPQIGLLPRHVSEQSYVGTVHCLTVPTGAYLTRRDGKMAIAGNSQMFDAAADVMCMMLTQEKGDVLGVGVKGTKANDIRIPPLKTLAYHFDGYGLDSVRAAYQSEFLLVETQGRVDDVVTALTKFVIEHGETDATTAANALDIQRTTVAKLFSKSPDFVFVRKDGRKALYAVRSDRDTEQDIPWYLREGGDAAPPPSAQMPL